MARYSHLVSVGFSVETNAKEFDDIPLDDIMRGLRSRYDDLASIPRDEAKEAFQDEGDMYEMDQTEPSLFRCDGCGSVLHREMTLPARDLYQRLDVGGIYTDRECPRCHALAYPVKEA